MLELDLAVSRDDVLVVSHSPFLTQPVIPGRASSVEDAERVCMGPSLPPGTLIRSLTLAQLRLYDCGSRTLAAFPHQRAAPHTPMATFDEVLALAPLGTFHFNVETKIFPGYPERAPTPEVFVGLIDDAVRRHGLQSRVILQSFDFRTLRAMKERNPAIRRYALFESEEGEASAGPADQVKRFARIAEVSSAHILSPEQGLVTGEAVAEAHRLGLEVVPFTVNTVQGWQRMADAHVDAMITDDPAGLRAWLCAQDPPLHS